MEQLADVLNRLQRELLRTRKETLRVEESKAIKLTNQLEIVIRELNYNIFKLYDYIDSVRDILISSYLKELKSE